MSQLADVVGAAGGAQPFADMLRQLQELARGSGGTGVLSELFRDLTQVITGAGGAEGLLQRLMAERGVVVQQAAPRADSSGAELASQAEVRIAFPAAVLQPVMRQPGATAWACFAALPARPRVQALAALKAKVGSLEDEVMGFNSTIEELRAAGRVEAMEDLMTNLLGELVRAVLACFGIVVSCAGCVSPLVLLGGATLSGVGTRRERAAEQRREGSRAGRDRDEGDAGPGAQLALPRYAESLWRGTAGGRGAARPACPAAALGASHRDLTAIARWHTAQFAARARPHGTVRCARAGDGRRLT